MCRLAAYLGPPVPLSRLLFDPPRSLEVQAHDPREQLHGTLNVDGTGVAWWNGDGEEPLRYVNDRPPWSDPNLRGLAPRLTGRVQLAAVRSATVGHPFGPGNVAPFTYGHFSGAHNGFLGRYREATARPLTALLPDSHYSAMSAVSDSLTLFLRAVALHEERPADGLAAAVRRTVLEVGRDRRRLRDARDAQPGRVRRRDDRRHAPRARHALQHAVRPGLARASALGAR